MLLNDNMNDNDDIIKKMRGLYARANSVLRKFAACSFEVKLRLLQAFCTSFYCAHLWNTFTKHVISKVRVAYNDDVFRLLFGYRRSCCASEMFVNNNIYNFEGRLRKIYVLCFYVFLSCMLWASGPEINVILSYLILLCMLLVGTQGR